MGAYIFEIQLHDDEAQTFVTEVLGRDWGTLDPDDIRIIQNVARYVAEKMILGCPELDPTVYKD